MIELPGGYWVNREHVLTLAETEYEREWRTLVRMLDGHAVNVPARAAVVAEMLNEHAWRLPPAEQQPAPWSEQR